MPYSIGLLGSMPRIDAGEKTRLTPIKGSPPSLINTPPGCPFGPRCPLHYAQCDVAEPDLRDVDGSAEHSAACIRVDEIVETDVAAEDIFTADSADITMGAPAEVAAGADVADEPVPIEEIIAHNEEIAEQLEHGELEHSRVTPLSAGAVATDHAGTGSDTVAGTTGPAGGTPTGGTGPAGGSPAVTGSAGGPTAGSADTGGPTTTGPGRGEDAAARRDPEEQA
jgi:oligopeptide/dipeptide ABC transporter ATP-binding protein